MRRMQEQAEARRRAQEARQLHDDEDEEDTEAYDEEIDEEDARDDAHAAGEAARQASAAEEIEERRQADNFRKEEALSKEEARRRKEERREAEKLEKKRAKEEAALEKERRKAEEKERRRAEKEEREREKQAAKEKERAEKEARRAAEAAEASKEAANTGEGILEKYLRRAREKVQGSDRHTGVAIGEQCFQSVFQQRHFQPRFPDVFAHHAGGVRLENVGLGIFRGDRVQNRLDGRTAGFLPRGAIRDYKQRVFVLALRHRRLVMRQRPDLRRAQKRRRRVPDLLVQRIARAMMHTGKAHFLLVHSILQHMILDTVRNIKFLTVSA